MPRHAPTPIAATEVHANPGSDGKVHVWCTDEIGNICEMLVDPPDAGGLLDELAVALASVGAGLGTR